MEKKKRILVIDDEESLCKLIKINLELTGRYDVDMAFSGEAGVEKAEKQDFDLVITDFKMPGMNGLEVLERIKRKKPRSPVVLVSVYHDDSSTITNGIKKKADGLISKPFDNQELVAIINEIMARNKPESQAGLSGQ